jgi:hypothetical protein
MRLSMLNREVCWTPCNGPGLEHLRLTEDGHGVLADGVVLGIAEGTPFRAQYRVRCDAAWRVREVTMDPLDGRAPLHLRADGAGVWTDGVGAALPALAGCIDIDLSISPFTNTLPIRRLAFGQGEARVLMMAYIRAPELTVEPMQQRYTRLATDRYRYENVDSDFTADLSLDVAGLVLDYPGLFRRVWPG